MDKKILSRIIIDILITISLLNGWWFCVLPLCIIGCFMFPYFFEAILAGIAYDSLFNLIKGTGVYALVGTISAVIIMLVGAILKNVLRKRY